MYFPPGPIFNTLGQFDPWIQNQMKIILLSTISLL